MSLYTGKRLNSYQWTKPPINDDVSSQVRNLDEREDAKKMRDNYPMLKWAPGVLITDIISK